MTVRSLTPTPRGFHGDSYLQRLVDTLARSSSVFIETGSNVGSSLADLAARHPDIECFSCEPDPAAFQVAKAHAVTRPGVHLFQETSQEFMKRFEASHAERFQEPLLAWLDAHDYGFEWPLREEIAFLTQKFARGAILVDDFQVPGRPEFGWDQYGEHTCSFDYIESSIQEGVAWRLSYPSYSEHTSKWHPLRGWGLLQFAPTLDEIPKVAELMPDVCMEARAHGPSAMAAAPTRVSELDAKISELLVTLEQRVHDPLPWNDIGVCLAEKGEIREALFSFGEALNIDPLHPDAYANCLVTAASQGDPAGLPLPVAPGYSGPMVSRDPYQDMKSLVDLPEPLIIDGGANRGHTVAKLRASFPQATIHAFEPIPDLARLIQARYQADPRVIVSACALSSSEGPISFDVCDKDYMSSMMPMSEHAKRYHGEEAAVTRTVQTLKRRLDRALPRPADIIKLDLQGQEIEALEGAGNALEHVRVILTEVEFITHFEGQPLFGEVDAFMRSKGFRLFNLYQLWSHLDGQLTSGDAIYVNTRYYA